MYRGIVISAAVLFYFATICSGRLSTRCYVCRSRGDQGDCKDSFKFNDTSIKDLPGAPVSVTSCPSGWCRKQTEGIRGPADEYGSATDRSCLSQAPNDGEERCAEVKIRNKVTRLCLCRGDLCNSASTFQSTNLFNSTSFILSLITLAFCIRNFSTVS